MPVPAVPGLSNIAKASVLAAALYAGFAHSAQAQSSSSPLLVAESVVKAERFTQNQGKPKVGVGIIIAVDVSGSSEMVDYDKMLRLYGNAFRSEQVQAAIEAADGIAVAVLQFANKPALATDWVIIKGPHDLKDLKTLKSLSLQEREKLVEENRAAISRQAFALARQIISTPRVPQQLVGSGTFLSHAVQGAGKLVRDMPFEADHLFMDLNCDGPDGYRNALQAVVEKVAAQTGLKVHGNDFARGIERTAVGENIGDYSDFFDYLYRNLIPSAEAKGIVGPSGYPDPVPSGMINSFEGEGSGAAMPGILAHKIYPAAG